MTSAPPLPLGLPTPSSDPATAALELIGFLEARARELSASAEEAAEGAREARTSSSRYGRIAEGFAAAASPQSPPAGTSGTPRTRTAERPHRTPPGVPKAAPSPAPGAPERADSAGTSDAIPSVGYPPGGTPGALSAATLASRLRHEVADHDLTRHRLAAARERVSELTSLLHAAEARATSAARENTACAAARAQEAAATENRLRMATEDADEAIALAGEEGARAEAAEAALERLLRTVGCDDGVPGSPDSWHGGSPPVGPVARYRARPSPLASGGGSVASVSPSVRSVRAGREILAKRTPPAGGHGRPSSPDGGGSVSSSSSVASSSSAHRHAGGHPRASLGRAAVARDRLAGRVGGTATAAVVRGRAPPGVEIGLHRSLVGAADARKISEMLRASRGRVARGDQPTAPAGTGRRRARDADAEGAAAEYVREMETIVSKQRDEMDKMRNFCSYLEGQITTPSVKKAPVSVEGIKAESAPRP